jgi:hypothetical protein
MHAGTSRRVNTTECLTQELPEVSEGRVLPHLISLSCEASMILGVKLQSGKELLDQPRTIFLLEDH